MPTVSVVMCVYNTNKEDVLRQSINSILTQTFSDFELIICDDGSTDGTYELLWRISQWDKRVKLIRNEVNLKSGAARNRCIDISQGRYVAIMDADDCSRRDRLELQVNFLEQHPHIDFVGSSAGLFAENGVWGHRRYVDYPQKTDFLFVLPYVHASLMFRKNVLDAVGGYPTSRHSLRSEDYALLMKLYAYGNIGANLQDELYLVREDNAAFRRRKYRYRMNEALVRYKGFKSLGLFPSGLLYVVKPLFVGMIPNRLLNQLKKVHYRQWNIGGL